MKSNIYFVAQNLYMMIVPNQIKFRRHELKFSDLARKKLYACVY